MDLTTLPLFATPGTLELAVILLIAVLLFGANKIPKLARSTGQAMGEFQRGREEIEEELEDMRDSATQSPGTQNESTPSTQPESTQTTGGEETTQESGSVESESTSEESQQSNN